MFPNCLQDPIKIEGREKLGNELVIRYVYVCVIRTFLPPGLFSSPMADPVSPSSSPLPAKTDDSEPDP